VNDDINSYGSSFGYKKKRMYKASQRQQRTSHIWVWLMKALSNTKKKLWTSWDDNDDCDDPRMTSTADQTNVSTFTRLLLHIYIERNMKESFYVGFHSPTSSTLTAHFFMTFSFQPHKVRFLEVSSVPFPHNNIVIEDRKNGRKLTS
jgi:hypothetical protein